MSDTDQILTKEQAILVQYIASGNNIAETARLMGIADKTARRWLKLPHVKAALDEATGQIVLDVKTKVRQHFETMTDKALTAIDECLDGGILVPPAVRLKASQLVLDRVAPAETDSQEQSDQALDASLMAYMSDEEIQTLEGIVAKARARKEEAESSNVTPLRKSS